MFTSQLVKLKISLKHYMQYLQPCLKYCFNVLSDLLGISLEVNQRCISHHQQEERQSQDCLQARIR